MTDVHLGFEVGTGAPITIPMRHMVVTGQTQEAGKTTALEAMIARAGVKAVAFITKRGEGSFAGARVIQPYFREQADWQFVASILEASRGEKLKFERAWIIRASKGATTLADVQENVRRELEKAKGLSADVYLTLDAYLEAVVPQISQVRWAKRVELATGVSAMDLTNLNVEMQHLVIRSTIAWVLEHEKDTVVVVPEAWKFIPQGRGTPVKLAAESFIRQAAGLRNYLWLDSQDIAGVEKMILKSVPVWILGVQRESNEVKRTLDQIPAGIKKPKPEAVATLGLGQFFACYGTHVTKVYAQPIWMTSAQAQGVARREIAITSVTHVTPVHKDHTVTETEARELRETNARLERDNQELRDRLSALEGKPDDTHAAVPHAASKVSDPRPMSGPTPATPDIDAIYDSIARRLQAEAPAILKVLTLRPEITVEVERKTVTVDGTSLKGRVARLLAKGFFQEARTQGNTRSELKKTGPDINTGHLSKLFGELLIDGFFQKETADSYVEVPEMKVNVVER